MQFWVFSYNRAEFLKNCIASIERCAPQCKINVFDDGSTDADTQRVLDEIGEAHRVVYPNREGDEGGKHGGLYGNMQAALEASAADDVVCFIQDDTQLVRAISDKEIAEIAAFFDRYPDAGFLQPAFMRGCNRPTDQALTRYIESDGIYFVDRLKSSAGAFYSDIFIAKVSNLRAVHWRFCRREPVNEQQARGRLRQMGYLKNPFVAWLPYVPAYRGKVQTRTLKWAQHRRGCGFYPFQIMSEPESLRLQQRDATVLPYAEDFLTPTNAQLAKPWIYYPLQGSRALKQLDRIERKLAGLMGQR